MPGGRAVETGELPAVPVEDEGGRRPDRESPGERLFGIHIDPDDFEPAGAPDGEIVDKGLDCAAVAAPPGPEFGEHCLGPVIDLLVIARRRYVKGGPGKIKLRFALAADRMALQFFSGNAVQRSAGPAAQED